VKPGNGVGMGKDHTIFALVEGVVKFENHNRTQKRVSVIPA
jgi:large subunit ribosomal protein L27